MILVKPSFEVLSNLDGAEILRSIEAAGRTCYKSEDGMTDASAKEFAQKIIKREHESVIEHESVSVRFVVDRGVSHELVRHRLAAYSQESTRYCDYAGGHVTFVIPPWCKFSSGEYTTSWGDTGIRYEPHSTDISRIDDVWAATMASAERRYQWLRGERWTPQQARSVLPNSLKTEIVMTANLREWRHVFSLRTSAAAHPQMREVMVPLLKEFQSKIPVVFDEL